VNTVPDDLVAAGYKIAYDPGGKLCRWEHVSGVVGDWWTWMQVVEDARKRIELEPPLSHPAPIRAKPDERIEDAQMLIDLLIAARDTAREHYGELTGRHSDLLSFERAVETMLVPLRKMAGEAR
jgi:hypothetical protein